MGRQLKILDKIAICHKLVYEVRYQHGFVYLDRCGATANRILATDSNWVLSSDSPTPQNAPLINAVSGTVFNFGPLKYDFSLEQQINRETAISSEDIDQFISQVDSVSHIVHEELELKTFVREGFRVWFLFGTNSEQDSQKWISNLGSFRVAPSLTEGFQGTLDSEGHVAVVSSGDRKYRISVSSVERQGQLDIGSAFRPLPRDLPKGQKEAMIAQAKVKKRLFLNPEFAVMIDVDANVDWPIEVVPGDFIRQSLTTIEQSLPRAFPGGKP
jgi:hypothetical protein